jgi:hypothetical protein
MSNIFLYRNGSARELSLVEWLDLWASLPPELSVAIEAGVIIALGDGAQVWKRS